MLRLQLIAGIIFFAGRLTRSRQPDILLVEVCMHRFPEEKFSLALELPGEVWGIQIECEGEETAPIIIDAHFTVTSERPADDVIPF